MSKYWVKGIPLITLLGSISGGFLYLYFTLLFMLQVCGALLEGKTLFFLWRLFSVGLDMVRARPLGENTFTCNYASQTHS